ncbi:hypothetical protein D9M68_624590 [compost metagenome]
MARPSIGATGGSQWCHTSMATPLISRHALARPAAIGSACRPRRTSSHSAIHSGTTVQAACHSGGDTLTLRPCIRLSMALACTSTPGSTPRMPALGVSVWSPRPGAVAPTSSSLSRSSSAGTSPRSTLT